MSRFIRITVLASVALVAATAEAVAWDHREAEFVAENPKVDGSDFYMFRSYEWGREDFVVLLASYQPFQVPFAGPQGYTMDPDALYDINVDNDGDGVEDVTFRFRFGMAMGDTDASVGNRRNSRLVSRPLMAAEQVAARDPQHASMAVVEHYTVEVILRGADGTTSVPLRHVGERSTEFCVTPNYLGDRTMPDYAGMAAAHVFDVVYPGGYVGRLFVGPRRDPLAFDMGDTFDLLDLPPVGETGSRKSSLAGFNVTLLALEVPVPVLRAAKTVIGAWTTASLPAARTMRAHHEFDGVDDEFGRPVQVSRVGAPLVNSLLIGMVDKDAYNGAHPTEDARFAEYFTYPVLPKMIEDLLGFPAPRQFPRDDLQSFFLRGVPGLTETPTEAAVLRLRYAVEPVRARAQSPLGVLGGDLGGYPNGRRPGDDVVDITLRVLMGANLDPSDAPSGDVPFTDGAASHGLDFPEEFPFLLSPAQGAIE